MKTIVLGAGGMLGHVLSLKVIASQAYVPVLLARAPLGHPGLDPLIIPTDLSNFVVLEKLLESQRPCHIVNCAGIPPRPDFSNKDLAQINSLLPQFLNTLVSNWSDGSRLTLISSDGVFSGSRGRYNEDDLPDATTPYGRSKAAGECIGANTLTIRTSFIGPDMKGNGLLEWLLTQHETVSGYQNVFWSGVSSLVLADFILSARALPQRGIIHIYGSRVSKLELLQTIKRVFDLSCSIIATPEPRGDWSLRSKYNLGKSPDLGQMLIELRNWRRELSYLYPKAI
jgi:dTDP-4-dehydrorhamnose reductase